jgi:hypothetical protein
MERFQPPYVTGIQNVPKNTSVSAILQNVAR